MTMGRLLRSLPLLALLGVAAGFLTLKLRTRGERKRVDEDPRISVESLTDDTWMDGDGAVCSVQAGDVWVPTSRLQQLWTPAYLERLARTYWFHLGRISFRLLRVMYTAHGRAMALFGLIPLITFHEPEYDFEDGRGRVRWVIDRGILVSRRTKGGYLEIVVDRGESDREGFERVHVELRIANFYPAIAERISRRLYTATQSRIHVFVVYAFLRSLSRGELAPSKVGRFAQWPKELDERRQARAAGAR